MSSDARDFEERYSACFKDFALKTVTGMIIGSMIGGFFMRGYGRWPMIISGGIGFGMAFTNCENSLNDYLLSKSGNVCKVKKMP